MVVSHPLRVGGAALVGWEGVRPCSTQSSVNLRLRRGRLPGRYVFSGEQMITQSEHIRAEDPKKSGLCEYHGEPQEARRGIPYAKHPEGVFVLHRPPSSSPPQGDSGDD